MSAKTHTHLLHADSRAGSVEPEERGLLGPGRLGPPDEVGVDVGRGLGELGLGRLVDGHLVVKVEVVGQHGLDLRNEAFFRTISKVKCLVFSYRRLDLCPHLILLQLRLRPVALPAGDLDHGTGDQVAALGHQHELQQKLLLRN